MILNLPVGSQIIADDGETVLADLTKEGQEIILASGGIGGKGNAFFKSSTNQAPRKAQPGEKGSEMGVASAEIDRRCWSAWASKCR